MHEDCFVLVRRTTSDPTLLYREDDFRRSLLSSSPGVVLLIIYSLNCTASPRRIFGENPRCSVPACRDARVMATTNGHACNYGHAWIEYNAHGLIARVIVRVYGRTSKAVHKMSTPPPLRLYDEM